jgi:retron-type reverse transcriptase
VADLDAKLDSIRAGLLAGDLTLGSSIQFTIHDPKKRLITAPCFRERVIHHAIMNVCEPVFDRWLIADTYACRKGKGRNAALTRAREFAGRFPFFLKMDVRKYFDSISHVVLNARLARLFKDRRLLDLFGRIIACHDVTRERGLPIGSLTSQHFANFYLGWFDRFVKETLRVPGYVRYMDDCVLWGESSRELGSKLASCREFLSDKLELTTKADPYINRTTHGMDFLGSRVFRSHLELNRRSRVRFVRKLQGLETAFREGEIGESQLQEQGTALVAFARSAGVTSWQFRHRVLENDG